MATIAKPKIILLFSGKRKSGKDYTVEKLKNMLGDDKCEIIRISEPIKAHWAKTLGLELNELLGDGPYKEKYREDMIKWSDEVRKNDYGYFCKSACSYAKNKPIWIVSDIRRKTDLKWFSENYGDLIKTVRIFADNNVRSERGWKFKTGVDDTESECSLDDYQDWDFQIENNNSIKYEEDFQRLYKYITSL